MALATKTFNPGELAGKRRFGPFWSTRCTFRAYTKRETLFESVCSGAHTMEITPRRVKRGVTMKRQILGGCLGTVALVAAALLIARLGVQAALPEDNKEVPQLLEDIK